jgi:molybdopterin converting factor small subunit
MKMKMEFPHVQKGDKKIEIDTDTEEGKQKVVELFHELLRSGTAIFLERADGETRRVTGYDPATDKLNIQVQTKGGRKAKTVQVATQEGDQVTAIPPVSGGK